MNAFLTKLNQQLFAFSDVREKTVTLYANCFSEKEETVDFFIEEIRATALRLEKEKNSEYANFYAETLIQQFDSLRKAVERLRAHSHFERFQTHYQFAKNIHNLPEEKQLEEYHKIFRALEDKEIWIMEKLYQAQLYADDNAYHHWQGVMAETELRKKRCLEKINSIEKPKQ